MTKARENSDYTGLQGDLALKSPAASPVFTGIVQVGNGTGGAGGVKYPYGGSADTRNWRTRSDITSYGDWGIEQSTTKTGETYATKLLINPAGIVTKPNQPAFRVCKDTGDTTSTGYIVWNASKINVGGHYSTSTGKFTAPVAGNYYFAVRALTLSATQNNIWIGINHNGNAVLQTYHSHINHSNISGEAVITMAANDYVQTYWGGTGGIHTGGTNHHVYSFFQGHLIG